jgi:alpha-galactosidase
MPDYFNYFNHEIQCPYWKFPKIRDVPLLDKARRGAYFGFKLMKNSILPVPGPKKEGEHAMEMTMDWRDSNPTHHVVNIPNKGIVPELPEDCIVEVPGFFKDHIIHPVGTIHLSKDVADLLRPHAEQHRYTVNAALGNNLDLVVKAMKHDPMVHWIEDEEKIEYLTKLMLYYQQEWLPEAWKEWIPKETELKQSKYWVSRADIAKKNKAYLVKKFPLDEKLRRKAFFWPN